MIYVYKRFCRFGDKGLRSLVEHPHSLWYPEDGTIVKPSLAGSLLYGYTCLDEADPWTLFCGAELWLCQTSGPIVGNKALLSAVGDLGVAVTKFWRGIRDPINVTESEFSTFPDVRLIKRVQ